MAIVLVFMDSLQHCEEVISILKEVDRTGYKLHVLWTGVRSGGCSKGLSW